MFSQVTDLDVHLNITCWMGGMELSVISGRDLSLDKEVPQARMSRVSESNHRLLMDCTLEAI